MKISPEVEAELGKLCKEADAEMEAIANKSMKELLEHFRE